MVLKKNIMKMFILLFILSMGYGFAYAEETCSGLACSVFGKGTDFFQYDDTTADSGIGGSLATLIQGDIYSLVVKTGNFIFCVVVMALGIKYIFASIEGKASIKESVPNLIVGIVFFYLAVTLKDGFFKTMKDVTSGLTADVAGGAPYGVLLFRIYNLFKWVIDTCAITGIILIGLKYMFTTPDGKAEVKKKLLPMALGIVFVYSASTVITYVVEIAKVMGE